MLEMFFTRQQVIILMLWILIYQWMMEKNRKLESLFREFIVPFTDLALSRLGLRELAKEEKSLLPAVKEGLTILS